jgi:hypothetical protein
MFISIRVIVLIEPLLACNDAPISPAERCGGLQIRSNPSTLPAIRGKPASSMKIASSSMNTSRASVGSCIDLESWQRVESSKGTEQYMSLARVYKLQPIVA